MSDKATAWLRTVVPAAWGSLIVWLVAQVPDLPESVVTWLTSEATVTVVVALAIGLWYWLWRKIEGRIPDWLIRIVLGSSKSPTYDVDAIAQRVADAYEVTSVTPLDATVTGDPMVRVIQGDPEAPTVESHFGVGVTSEYDMPNQSAPKSAWVEAARRICIDPTGLTKDQIVAAVRAAE